ncbi:MAG: universal stress protein [Erythrobacter sp.]
MKSILPHISGDVGMEARLQAALDLARAHSAHLTCLQAVNCEFYAPGDFFGTAMAVAVPHIKKAAEELRAKIEAALAKEDVAWEWVLRHGMAETMLLEQSVLQDLIIVGRHDVGSRGRSPSSLVGELALNAPAPVLVIPDELERLDTAGPVMVAWNGSSEACVALRSALPVLGTANEVILANVSEEADRERFDFPPVEGAKYLSRHGIEAELVDIPRGDEKVAEAMFTAAKFRGCSMLVMGAFGHSRLSEFLLGGVTRSALMDPQLPILLAH